jgi:RNA polymerase sigma factor (TIGR02999 family)
MGEVTQLLERARAGDADGVARVFALLYGELRALAGARLRGADATLSPTVLVHETYLRLCAGDTPPLESRRHFFAAAAQAMRWILVDHARRQLALRRGGDLVRVELEEDEAEVLRPEQVVELDAALQRLGEIDPAKRELVELRYFAGLEYVDLAALTGRSERSLKRDWAAARTLLHALLG